MIGGGGVRLGGLAICASIISELGIIGVSGSLLLGLAHS